MSLQNGKNNHHVHLTSRPVEGIKEYKIMEEGGLTNNYKRNRVNSSFGGEDNMGDSNQEAKKPRDDSSRQHHHHHHLHYSQLNLNNDEKNEEEKIKRRLGDSGDWTYDSDSDYDDLDDMVSPSDIEDFDFDNEEDAEDDRSTVSNTTNSSVGSNTPSLVGENLENFSLGETSSTTSCDIKSEGVKSKNCVGNGPLLRNPLPPLRLSLFPNIPPYIQFFHHNEVSDISLPEELRKHLKWKLSNITPAVVKRVVTNSGFRLMRKTATEWGGTWGNHMKSAMFKDISEASKINHFPGTFNIGRKDRLWKNYHSLKLKFGKEEFSFLPRTFCLPQDSKLLRKVWEKRGGREKWIVKPPALSRGTGIKVVSKWSEVPKSRPLIVQKYVSKPHLINNTKYDLRIYVLLTSVNPLKIYLYDDGLVRFASNKYDPDPKSLNDVYMHLTNYSINKNSSTYCHNEDADSRQGHKWTLASLRSYFSENNLDYALVWNRIKDLVIKTFISAEEQMFKVFKNNIKSNYAAYELFGFDVLLDAKLKPWLIEVNISPSLHSASPLDLDVKSNLAAEVFNIVGYHVPAKMTVKTQKSILAKLNIENINNLVLDKRLYTRDISKVDKAKMDSYNQIERDKYISSILDKLTAGDVRFLVRAEDELSQTQHFERIFPTPETHKYFKFFTSGTRYYNMLLDAWENKYGSSTEVRLRGRDLLSNKCADKLHLKVPNTTNLPNAKKKSQIVDVSMLKAPTSSPTQETCEKPSEGSSKVSRVAVTSKPMGVRPLGLLASSNNIVRKQFTPSKPITSTIDNTVYHGSPEPMSISGDSEKSRSPSPDNKFIKPESPSQSTTINTFSNAITVNDNDEFNKNSSVILS